MLLKTLFFKKRFMRYLCTNCNYVYDESLGDSVDFIDEHTLFDNLGEDFVCPVCAAEKDDFFMIKEEVNYIWDTMSSLETEHFIDIYIEDDFLEVSVPNHSNIKDHRISEISLFDDDGELLETIFISTQNKIEANFDISFLDEFEIRIRCSSHWVWWRKISR